MTLNSEEKVINQINEKLKGSTLFFVSFDEFGYINRRKTHVLLKCNNCGTISKRALSWIYDTDNILKCKVCQVTNKFTEKEAIDKVNEKCKTSNYTFLGFNNKENKYEGKNTYLILRCNICGKEWSTTTFESFLQNEIRCSKCNKNWVLEDKIENLLKNNNINFISQCRRSTLPWLTNKISLSLDFYLPDFNIGIECQGIQHFEPVDNYGGKKTFYETSERDKIKLDLCKNNGVKLLYYSNTKKYNTFLNETLFKDENKLLKEIYSTKHGE